MRLHIEESTLELMALENRNPVVRNRLRFIRSFRTAPFIDFESAALKNGINVEDAAQWLLLYAIGGVELLMNPRIMDPSITGRLSISALARHVPPQLLAQLDGAVTTYRWESINPNEVVKQGCNRQGNQNFNYPGGYNCKQPLYHQVYE
jgi:hypothetical protein